tara:strand:+ start:891 stop:1064 length:174 start_codon:yes stop_codon:yes gene_type:complete
MKKVKVSEVRKNGTEEQIASVKGLRDNQFVVLSWPAAVKEEKPKKEKPAKKKDPEPT